MNITATMDTMVTTGIMITTGIHIDTLAFPMCNATSFICRRQLWNMYRLAHAIMRHHRPRQFIITTTALHHKGLSVA